MVSLLSNLVDNLAEGIHQIKCKQRHDNKHVKHPELSTKIASAKLNIKY